MYVYIVYYICTYISRKFVGTYCNVTRWCSICFRPEPVLNPPISSCRKSAKQGPWPEHWRPEMEIKLFLFSTEILNVSDLKYEKGICKIKRKCLISVSSDFSKLYESMYAYWLNAWNPKFLLILSRQTETSVLKKNFILEPQ